MTRIVKKIINETNDNHNFIYLLSDYHVKYERLRQGPVTDIHHRSPAYSFIYK